MLTLLELMKSKTGPASPEHIAMAEGRRAVTDADTNVHLRTLDETRQTIDKAFQRQREAQAVRTCGPSYNRPKPRAGGL